MLGFNMLQRTTRDVVAGLSNEWAYSAQQSSEQQYTFTRGAVNSKKRQRSKSAAVSHTETHNKTSQKGEASVGRTAAKGSGKKQQR